MIFVAQMLLFFSRKSQLKYADNTLIFIFLIDVLGKSKCN